MPLTPDKKVDRRALLAPKESEPELKKPFTAPRNSAEKRLAEIWGQVLSIDKIGIHDSFLDLGGDTIQGVQTVAKAAQSGLRLSVRRLLDRVNLAELASQAGEISEASDQRSPSVRTAAAGLAGQGEVISPRDGDENLPLTYAQRPIWFLDQLKPGGHHNDRVAIRLTGFLDNVAFERSINQIIRRHEALRTNFVVRDGRPVQVVQPHRSARLCLVDLAQVDALNVEGLARRIAAQASRRPFSLSQGPLLRIILIRLSESEHYMLLTAHQIINDSWSLGVWMRELTELYECYSTGAPVTLPALRIQYPDFAVWQQSCAGNGGRWQNEMAYWRDQLAGYPSVLRLPTDRPRPSVQTYRGARNYFHIPSDLAERAKQTSRCQGATLFMTLLGVFNILLCRYSRQEDILVGTPIAYRNLPELEGLIGDFINMLVLRTDLSGDPSFEELLARVREMVLQAYAHPDLPLEKLVQELHPDRDASRNPLFQVMIEDQKPPKPLPQFRGLGRDLVEIDPRIARFALTLEFCEMDETFRSCIEYSTDLFDAATIGRMVAHFKSLLEQAVSHPRQAISAIPMLREGERHQLVEEWNASATPYPAHLGIHQLFERQADQKPNSIAAILPSLGSSGLTYGDLESRSNRLARHLRRAGLRPGMLAGLCVDRSAEMLVGLLGILKAGGAYVPLDPSFPSQRLQYMLEDSAASFLLSQEAVAAELPESSARLLCLDRDWKAIEKEEDSRLKLPFDPAQPAYVIYTSGSTGRPKGVQIPHQAVLNFLFSMQEKPGFSPEDVLLSVTTLSFDISVLEIFLPFLTGGKIVLPSREDTFDGNRLVELLQEYKISVMQATPSTWRVLLQAGWQGDAGLKVLCGGEALPKDLAARLCGRCESLWNMYGPTETTVWSSVLRVDSPHRISIGRPIANTQIHLLNHLLQPVPAGVSGQLHIGGDGLAQGYFGRPRMTAERFIPDPFASQPGSRLYDTGDLARRLADGRIEFSGRLDHQLKIRGFRIEAGEIETTLSRHPSVNEAVVVARQDIPGDKRLIAYVVPRQEAPSVSVWRNHLKESLPDYMMPSAFVTLEEIPLTANRKINRRALPAPESSNLDSQGDYLAPGDTVERQLVNWWEDALGTRPIGVRADFFDLGGHSLLAAKLFSRIEETFGKRLPLAILFQKPTIQQLAEILRQEDWKPNWSCLVPIQPRGAKPPLFLVHGAGGNVLLYRDLALSLDADQPVYGLQSKGLDTSADALTRLEEMAAHYLKEVRSLQAQGPYYLGGYCLGGMLAYEMARQLHLQGQRVALLAMFETYNLQAFSNKLSLPVRTVHLVQNVGFHLGNLMSLSASEKATFLNRKASVARRRIRARVDFFKSRFFGAGAQNGNHHSLSFIRSINDQAQLDYLPGSYAGRVTLFRPNKLFWGFEDPQFGWKDLVAGGVEVIEVPIQPRAMLVAPLVRHLATRLQHCIDQPAAQISRKAEKPRGSKEMQQ